MSSPLGLVSSFRPDFTISLMHKDARLKQHFAVFVSAMYRKPLEELYNVRFERKASSERLEELGVSRWSVWKTGKCKLPWDWHVDQQVYITKETVEVFPEGCKESMVFNAGDLVRYPKWFEADLQFEGPYEEHYRFRAYGDDYQAFWLVVICPLSNLFLPRVF